MKEDVLYHFDLGSKTHDLPAMFGDIKVGYWFDYQYTCSVCRMIKKFKWLFLSASLYVQVEAHGE